MRLFVAVDLDEAVRQAASAVGDRLARALQKAAPGRTPGVSWVRAGNLHLTLRFLGEIEEFRAAALVARFAEPLRLSPFEIDLAGIGVFPAAGSPRVVWVGVTEGRPELVSLAASVEDRLDACGFGREPRQFQAHLTLGRCREPLTPRARDVLVDHAEAVTVGRSRVDHVMLMESQLSAGPPVYIARARAALVP